jgi:hypothetical protein
VQRVPLKVLAAEAVPQFGLQFIPVRLKFVHIFLQSSLFSHSFLVHPVLLILAKVATMQRAISKILIIFIFNYN